MYTPQNWPARGFRRNPALAPSTAKEPADDSAYAVLHSQLTDASIFFKACYMAVLTAEGGLSHLPGTEIPLLEPTQPVQQECDV